MNSNNLFEDSAFINSDIDDKHYVGAKKPELITMFIFLVQNEDWVGVKNMLTKRMIELIDFPLHGPLGWNRFSQKEICQILPLLLEHGNTELLEQHPQYMYNLSGYAGEKLYFQLANILNKFNFFYPENFYLSALYKFSFNGRGKEKHQEEQIFNYITQSKNFLDWACSHNSLLTSYIEKAEPTKETDFPDASKNLSNTPILNLIRRGSWDQIDFDSLKSEEHYNSRKPIDLMDQYPFCRAYPFYLYEKSALPLENVFYSIWGGLQDGQHLIYIKVRQHLTEPKQIQEFKKQMTILLKFFSGFKENDDRNSLGYILGAQEKIKQQRIDAYKNLIQAMAQADCIDLKLLLDLEAKDFCKNNITYYATRNSDMVKLVGKETLDKLILELAIEPINQPSHDKSKIRQKV